MSQELKKSKKILTFIYVALMFSLCVALFVYIFPKEPKFKYEFTKGSPWLYDDLIASFDFPIYKSDSTIIAEQDSIKKNFIPYYRLDTAIRPNIIDYFKNEFIHIKNDLLAEIGDNHYSALRRNRMESHYEDLKNKVINYLNKTYKTGVLNNDSLYVNKIFIAENEMVESVVLSDIHTTRDLADNLKSKMKQSELLKTDSTLVYEAFKKLFSVNNIVPNLLYDLNLNQTILNDKLGMISTSTGMIQAGELIILRGNIIDAHTYKILNSLKRIYESEESSANIYLIALGVSILLVSLFLGLFIYLKYYHKYQLFTYKTTTYIVVQILLVLLTSFIIIEYTTFSINLVPFTLIALLLLTFYNFHIAYFVYLPSILMIGFFVPNAFEFIFIQTSAGMMAMFSMRNIQKRSQIFISLFIVILTYSALHTGFSLMKHGSLSALIPQDYLQYAISSFLLLLFLPFIYMYEKIFGFVSDFSLMELSDTNHPALRKLAETAPGTFQHTLQVANLTESVVRELGGNTLLARTGALYHDIGKATDPDLFIENQANENIHDNFTYEKSAKKIINHIHSGISLAKKYNLPQQVTDFITMHHGTGVTKYFYNSWQNENPDKEPDKSKFTYPGPKPQTLETAILMMADSIEAASRSLKVYTEDNIINLVNNIIDSQLSEEQFSDVDITMKQISLAKEIFTTKLKNIYHSRIEYPVIKKSK